jgi:hypothetical protein
MFVCATFALGGLSWGAGALLSREIPPWAAAFAVAALWVTAGLVILRALRRRLPPGERCLGVLRLPGVEREAVVRQQAHNARVRAERELSETAEDILRSLARSLAAQGTEAVGTAVKEGVQDTISTTSEGVQNATGQAASRLAHGGRTALRGAVGTVTAPGRLAVGLALEILGRESAGR